MFGRREKQSTCFVYQAFIFLVRVSRMFLRERTHFPEGEGDLGVPRSRFHVAEKTIISWLELCRICSNEFSKEIINKIYISIENFTCQSKLRTIGITISSVGVISNCVDRFKGSDNRFR